MESHQSSGSDTGIALLTTADVVVVGGGSAGFGAALAAARGGSRTLLIEKNAIFGGVATQGMMMSIGNHLMTGGNEQAIRGIAEELIDALAARGATGQPWRDVSHHHITFDIETMIDVMFEKLSGAGVQMLINTTVTDTICNDGEITGLIVQHDKAGRFRVKAKCFIDTTGDSLLPFQAGDTTVPMKSSATVLYSFANVDLDRLYEFLRDHQDQYPIHADHDSTFAEFEKNYLETGVFHLPHGGGLLYSFIRDGVQSGALPVRIGEVGGLNVLGLFGLRDRKMCLINSNIFAPDCTDPLQQSALEIAARRTIFPCADFFRRSIPGFADAVLTSSGREAGLRFWRLIPGRYAFTGADKLHPSRFDDVVWCAPVVDSSEPGPVIGTEDFGAPNRPLTGLVKRNAVHEVPFRALQPEHTRNLLVASGKSIAAGSLRAIAHCLAAGQSAGAAAAVAVRDRCDFDHINIRHVQQELLRQKAYLGTPERLSELGLREQI